MARPKVLWILGAYEMRRALARKKVLTGVLLVLGSQLLLLYLFSRLLATGGGQAQADPSLSWIFVFASPSLLMPGLAVLVAAGSFSEEYERGSFEILLSRPLTRLEIFLGKILGGLVLQAILTALAEALALGLSYTLFGPQTELWLAPVLLLATIYSCLPFFSLAAMLSAVTRNTLVSTVVPLTLLLVLPAVESFLAVLQLRTGEDYSRIAKLFPTWASRVQIYTIPDDVALRAAVGFAGRVTSWGDPAAAWLAAAGYTALFLGIAARMMLYGDLVIK